MNENRLAMSKYESDYSKWSNSEKLVVPIVPAIDESVAYERLLDQDLRWALQEGSRHFEEDSAVFKALHKIARRLKDAGVPYAVVGGMALFRHGFRRFTEDIDVLVTRENLKLIHQKLDGLGYVPPHASSKNLRDSEFGVRIEFLLVGDFPGDGKKKPIAFPNPQDVSSEINGINYINLPQLIELKLASGMTNLGRLKDLADVLELIKILKLPLDFSEKLNAYVRGKYRELWSEAQIRYVGLWPKRDAIPDRAINSTEEKNKASELLERMKSDGIVLESHKNDAEGFGLLVTNDARLAEKYGLIPENEFWEVEQDRNSTDPN